MRVFYKIFEYFLWKGSCCKDFFPLWHCLDISTVLINKEFVSNTTIKYWNKIRLAVFCRIVKTTSLSSSKLLILVHCWVSPVERFNFFEISFLVFLFSSIFWPYHSFLKAAVQWLTISSLHLWKARQFFLVSYCLLATIPCWFLSTAFL